MAEYKTEILKVSYRLLKASIKEPEVKELDELINQRASEGWELVTYTFMGNNDSFSRGVLMTFKKG